MNQRNTTRRCIRSWKSCRAGDGGGRGEKPGVVPLCPFPDPASFPSRRTLARPFLDPFLMPELRGGAAATDRSEGRCKINAGGECTYYYQRTSLLLGILLLFFSFLSYLSIYLCIHFIR